MKPKAVLRARWMYADDRIHLCLRHTALEANSDTLGDLACVWSANMEANYFKIVLFYEDFRVSCALTVSDHFIECPFKWLEAGMICGYGFLSVLCLGIGLCQADSTVLDRSEDCRWYILVVHKLLRASAEACCEESSCLDRHWGEL